MLKKKEYSACEVVCMFRVYMSHQITPADCPCMQPITVNILYDMLACHVANPSNNSVKMYVYLYLIVELTILAVIAVTQGFSKSLLGGPAFILYIY